MLKIEFDDDKGKSSKYKIEVIWNNIVYTWKSESYLSELYYLVLLKDYLKEKNTWESVLSIQQL